MLEVSHKRIALRAAHSRAALIIYGGGFIPDIKEKQPLKKVAKEKPTAVPRELIKQQTIRAAAWTKNQLQDAARGGEKEEAQQESVPNLTQVIPTVRHSAKPTASDRNNAPKTRDVVQEREQGFVETSASSNRASPPKEQPAPAAQTVSTQPPTAGNSPAGHPPRRCSFRASRIRSKAPMNIPSSRDGRQQEISRFRNRRSFPRTATTRLRHLLRILRSHVQKRAESVSQKSP